MSDQRIKAGDTVYHRPSGETWWIVRVDDDGEHVYPGGWPPTRARASDCEIVESMEVAGDE